MGKSNELSECLARTRASMQWRKAEKSKALGKPRAIFKVIDPDDEMVSVFGVFTDDHSVAPVFSVFRRPDGIYDLTTMRRYSSDEIAAVSAAFSFLNNPRRK